jgi:hypothetical protein
MSRAREHVNPGAWALPVSAVGAMLVIVLPSLGMTTQATAGSAAVALLALALAGLVKSEIWCVAGALRPIFAAVASTRGEPAPMVPGRATDPVHHPLRPRAPGLT